MKTWALQGEVDRILEKGTLELVDHPGPRYYGLFYLVQRAVGGEVGILCLFC